MTSSPFRPNATAEEQLSYYKAQYEQLELELHEFQASSKDLEAELERDVEESEKRERKLKEQVENLRFEADEWKTKCKQTRDESNRAQTTLQKEITTMRENHRTLQLRLRDIEVANDDYERQARTTTSSLEDMESKFNVSIERGVLLEEEIRQGEKEREQLRIETQRLRDELSDLRVEFEITQEKLHHTEAALERSHIKRVPMYANPARPRSPVSVSSAVTPPSPSVTPSTTKAKVAEPDMPTPPSPPLSDTPGAIKSLGRTPLATGRKSLLPESGSTPRPLKLGSKLPRHSRGPSQSGQAIPGMPGMSSSRAMGPPPNRPSAAPMPSEGLPRSGSLYQIKGLIGRMQKIEERVQSVRAKLPPSTARTGSPRNSPRGADLPGSVTVRSARKRQSNISSISNGPELDSTGVVKRLSFGEARPASGASNVGATPDGQRPASRLAAGGAASTGLPTPAKSTVGGRRTSQVQGRGDGSMAPPPPRRAGVGETF